MKFRTRNGFGWGAAFLLALYSLYIAASFDKFVTVIVPDEFEGPIFVARDPTGVDIGTSFLTSELRVPDCGVVRVVSWKRLQRFNHYSAERESGGEIPTSQLAAPDAVAFQALGTRSIDDEEAMAFFVGTREQAERFDSVIDQPPLAHCDGE